MAELWQWNAPRSVGGLCGQEIFAGRGGAARCWRASKSSTAQINAFCLIDATHDLGAGPASEARWMKNAPLSPLDGVPVAIKDLLLTRGWPTLRGSRTIDPNQAWNDDAPAVARLREAGAVLLGKTTTPDMAGKA